MSNYERTARIEGIDVSTGVFEMTLATEGEASDGHILSIKGGQIPERMPLLVSHYNDPSSQAGSVTNPSKLPKDSPPRLRAVGRIEMSGEGVAAEIRRDLAHMIDKGHVGSMSIRWDEIPGKSVRRVNLPSNHKYFVDAEDSNGPERWGVFFEEWIGREGSIVALGADPGALIGRAEETEGEVSTFWRAMAEDAANEPTVTYTTPHEQPAPDEPTPEAEAAAALAGLRIHFADCIEAGVSTEEVLEALAATDGVEIPAASPREDDPLTLDLEPAPERVADLPAQEAPADLPSLLTLDVEALKRRVDVQALVESWGSILDERDKRTEQTVEAVLRRVLGKVS